MTELVKYSMDKPDTFYEIPDTVTKINNFAFKGCRNLESLIIPGSVKRIEVRTFEGCNSLKSVVMKDGVMYIDYGAFAVCSNLSSVTLSNTLKEIGPFAFTECDNLKSIVIPDSVESIGVYALPSITLLETDYYGYNNSRCKVLNSDGSSYKTIDTIFMEDDDSYLCDHYLDNNILTLDKAKEYIELSKAYNAEVCLYHLHHYVESIERKLLRKKISEAYMSGNYDLIKKYTSMVEGINTKKSDDMTEQTNLFD